MLFREKITKIELQFTDLLGILRSIEVNSKNFTEIEKSGKGFDGSSVGFVPVEKSDLLLKPIPETFFQLPWDKKVARFLCDIFRPPEKIEEFLKEKEFELSPRFILKKVLNSAKEKGFNFFISAEMEFFLLKGKEFIDHSFYFSPTPLDAGAKIRREIFDTLLSLNIPIEYSHHEVSKSQHEITLGHSDPLRTADNIVSFKYLAKNLAAKYGFSLTFMPKPFAKINGNGMHLHLSVFDKRKRNLFFGKERISETAKHFIAGILKHAKSIAAIAAPTVNSYKRLVPGYEAPVNICWGFINRSALIRVPAFSKENSARIELRMPDALSNPYLLFAVVLAAGMEGIEKNLDPGENCSINTYRNEEKFEKLPETLEEALKELRKDFLMKEVLGEALEKFISLKEKEWQEYVKVHPKWNPLEITEWEFQKYFDLI